jgi:hypothetical protein
MIGDRKTSGSPLSKETLMALGKHEPRKARLFIDVTQSGLDPFIIKFHASNSEPLGVGETHPTKGAAEESRKAWLRAMIEVLREEGYTVETTEDNDLS